MMAIVDDRSSILCQSGSSLAFPNMMMMVVEVGWLMFIACYRSGTAFQFVADSGQYHYVIPGRQGQIVVDGGPRSGGHMRATCQATLDVASGAVSFTVGRFADVVVASASTITITSTSRCY